MKSLFRWGALLGIASASIIAQPPFGQQMSAHALPEPQVMQILSTVPVFTLVNSKGQTLTATQPNPRDPKKPLQVYLFYIDRRDAEAALAAMRKNNPTLAKTTQVGVVPLNSALQIAIESSKKPANNIKVEILPNRSQMDAALAMLRQNGSIRDQGGQLVDKAGKPVSLSAPLFFVTNNKSEPLGLQRTFKENGKDKVVNVFPFFFSKQDAQAALELSRKQDGKLANSTKIETTLLSGLVNFLFTNNDPTTAQLELVPPRDSVEFIQGLRTNTPAPNRPTVGGAQPPAPAARPQ